MKLDSEMNTATMISQREKLLPPLQKREWALRKQRFELKTSTGFHDFLDYLNVIPSVPLVSTLQLLVSSCFDFLAFAFVMYLQFHPSRRPG
jgi:hypothetical protein